ncbi:hypothetical protein J3Q64DRAFT_1713638 [Phycomyces blakesleeanus]|uniref:MYND-type domain-containing protein n=2 Tax=Phycomyces blakesleeanus TaxID=4837 RepID=A0A167Q805_PHYB8|nr:hypothetical protein PHYBLDRAFT_162323 [Phycomyces blakesleeanus NRRL 1555(-)]OAD79246.1 hypothetical protein PHYBLDRAFT_162323 [Phycomyces blakesleeanus NRRL 1555(-)]|eukprot:XP_018297286.1 hypothetical protein PHYBLDRAFT_162323 [Phycomyces blakesleeanus NRRL 1555(-)]
MREPNLSFPAQSKAAVCITSALYDRRALDCTATLPLINSLTHLVYLTSTSPRIREILCLDGGLERLIRVLSPSNSQTDRRSLWKWSLAFQCVVNVGVRGTEHIRTKVVEAGMVPIVLRVLENFLRALEIVRQESERTKGSHPDPNPIPVRRLSLHSLSSLLTNELDGLVTPPITTATTVASTKPPTNAHNRIIRRAPYPKTSPEQRRRNRITRELPRAAPTWQDPRSPSIDNVFYREEDIMFSLQLLAYLSKYPHIRTLFHTAYDNNVFSIVERFCHKLHPSGIQYWAGVIMRNACRKDESRGGTRRCANMACGKWELLPREFAKCRRCRKAKYCSKACQSKAWADGHRWWCVERTAISASAPGTTAPNHNPPTTTTTTTTAPEADPRRSVHENNQATIVVNELTLPTHAHDIGHIEPELTDQTGTESRLLPDMGVHMEL